MQTFTSATRCWTCSMHDDPVGQHCCTFAVGTRLPLPLRVKLHAPLISEITLFQNTCHRVCQVHEKKIWIIWNKLYSFHTWAFSVLQELPRRFTPFRSVPDQVWMCITYVTHVGTSPKDCTRCLWLIGKFSHFAPKVQTIQTAKTPFVHYYSFFRHTGRGLSNSEVSFTGCATLLSCQQKLKLASENKGVTSAT